MDDLKQTASPKRPPNALHGVLIIDKPKGLTSHDVVAQLRRRLGVREIGHAGTLDPMATGVLVVAIGEATKLSAYLTAASKSYEARVELGVATNTLDAEGEVSETRALSDALVGELAGAHDLVGATAGDVGSLLERALAIELARVEQIPPQFSAIQKDGQRAYAQARRGETVELDARAVHVRELAFTGVCAEPPSVDVTLHVAKGYYVRAFARDFAAALGTVGHLGALRRTASGRFDIADASTLDLTRDALIARLIPLETAARATLPSATLSKQGLIDARHGRAVRLEDVITGDGGPLPHAWFDCDGALVAIGVLAGDCWKVVRGVVPRVSLH